MEKADEKGLRGGPETKDAESEFLFDIVFVRLKLSGGTEHN
jgi:hypothetical protein